MVVIIGSGALPVLILFIVAVLISEGNNREAAARRSEIVVLRVTYPVSTISVESTIPVNGEEASVGCINAFNVEVAGAEGSDGYVESIVNVLPYTAETRAHVLFNPVVVSPETLTTSPTFIAPTEGSTVVKVIECDDCEVEYDLIFATRFDVTVGCVP